jgi:hypothetical protein
LANFSDKQFPAVIERLPRDSWYVSQGLREKLIKLGWSKIVIVGKGNYIFDDNKTRQSATAWKKQVQYNQPGWGIEVEHKRKSMTNRTFGAINLLFFRHCLTRAFYLMDFSLSPLRSSE